MTVESESDLEALRKICRIVAKTLRYMQEQAKPGMSTAELDALGEKYLNNFGAVSAPRLMYDFPGGTCISINEQAAHGVPGDRVIQAGDLVNVDVSAELDGYFGDTGGSFVIPPAHPAKNRIIHATRLALSKAIEQAVAGQKLNKIGKAVQKVAKQKGYKIIKNLCSHGVGRSLHEEPKLIPSYYDPTDSRTMWEGLVMTLEPFLSTKTDYVEEAGDGWTLVGPRGNLSAQFEHTLVITRGKAQILTVA